MRSELFTHAQNILATTALLWDVSFVKVQASEEATQSEANTGKTGILEGDAAD